METKHIHIKDYNYALPDERIAKFPLAQRDHSKLLLYKHGEVSEDTFCNIANHLPEGALMVFQQYPCYSGAYALPQGYWSTDRGVPA